MQDRIDIIPPLTTKWGGGRKKKKKEKLEMILTLIHTLALAVLEDWGAVGRGRTSGRT